MSDELSLNDPVGESLRGYHQHLARSVGNAITYSDSVATFAAVPVDFTSTDWDDLAALLGPAALADMFSSPAAPTDSWPEVFVMEGLQLTTSADDLAQPARDLPSGYDVIDLGPDDVPDALALVEQTHPGPFWARTIEMGPYLGVRHQGQLVAMAGQRLHPTGWAEISTVCTHPSARGQGLAAHLVHRLARGILDRGERPFLHVRGDNHAAIGVYRRLGFTVRREVTFRGFRTPTG